MHIYGKDFRPMGASNPSLMLEKQLPPTSFETVQRIAYHMEMLTQLARRLPTMEAVYAKLYTFEGIQRYLGDIVRVSENLNDIVSMNHNLPEVQRLAPRIKDFTQQMEEVRDKLDYFHGNYQQLFGELNSKIKYLEDLYIQYEQGLKHILAEYKAQLYEQYIKYKTELTGMHQDVLAAQEYVQAHIPLVQNAVDKQASIEHELAHLRASDAVTTALFTNTEEDSAKALTLIKDSEKYGNDETLNRHRLNYKVPENSVSVVLKANQERLTKEGGCECQHES